MAARLGSPKAIAHLRTDPAMAKVIDQVGKFSLKLGSDIPPFEYFIRAIVFQQLSGKAAATIHTRFTALFGKRDISPKGLLGLPEDALRGAGLSRQKLGYLRDLAEKTLSGEVDLGGLDARADDEIIAEVTRIKGIGTWTAQMFLMFRLGRPDVLPVLDLGIQKAVQRAYRLRTRPTPKRVEEIGKKWRPHTTVASWYLWRSLDV